MFYNDKLRVCSTKHNTESRLFVVKTSLQVTEVIKLSVIYSTIGKEVGDFIVLLSWQAYEKT